MNTDLQRRNVFLTTVALASALIPGVDIASSVANKDTDVIDIEAPDDVFVVGVSSQNGPVKRGDLLLTLKSYRLLQMQNHVSLVSDYIAITERPFDDGRIDAEIQRLKDAADALKEISDIAQSRVDQIVEAYKMGVIPSYKYPDNFHMSLPTVSETNGTTQAVTKSDSTTKGDTTSNQPFTTSKSDTNTYNGHTTGTNNQLASISRSNSQAAESSEGTSSSSDNSKTESFTANPNYMNYEDAIVAADKAKNDLEKGRLSADQAEKQRQDAIDKIGLAKKKLLDQQQLLNELLEAMNVRCGTEGKFRAAVYPGSFVKKGHVLGRITL